MKKVFIGFLFLFSLISFSSKAQGNMYDQSPEEKQRIKEMMNSWNGKSKKQLLSVWGPPFSINSDGEGGQILHFIERKSAWNPYLKNYLTAVHTYVWFINEENLTDGWSYNLKWESGR